MSHLKYNYIFGILESRPMIWHTFKQISSTLNFWPPYNPKGSFWSPVFQNAQWCQSGISLFVCQDMSKSQKQQKYYNYTRLPSPKFILLFVNSTMQKLWHFNGSQLLAKMKKYIFLTCPCHKIYRVEAVGHGLESSKLNLRYTIFWVCEIWGNFVKNWSFPINNCLIKVQI